MQIQLQNCVFDTEDYSTGMYTEVIGPEGETLGWASFPEGKHWEWEHTGFVPVPRDLFPWGIDTSFEDGTSLFKNGVIVYDSRPSDGMPPHMVYAEAQEPAFGSRYIAFEDGSCPEYFDYTPEFGIFVFCLA